MGQLIEVEAIVADDIAVFVGNRTLTGQEGVGFDSATEASAGEDLPARLAGRLFEQDGALEHVYVVANQVAARRWCWRQSDQSAARDRTTEAIITVEAHHDDASNDVQRALDDLVELLETYCSAECSTALLDQNRLGM